MNAENGLLEMETSKTPLGITLMTDLGDHQHFGVANVDTFSHIAPSDVRPNGVIAGVDMVSVAASGGTDKVDTAAIVCMIKGVKTSVAAAVDNAITRPAGDVAKIISITIDEDGAVAVVEGADGADATFSAVRGAAGGPPLIPVDSIELAQVKVTTSAAAVITADQIVHCTEFAESFEADPTGRGDHSKTVAARRGHVKFGRVLPLIHIGPATRRVYLDAATPNFSEVARSVDFTPAEESISSSSSQHYGGVDNSDSKSLGQAAFKAKLADGVSDLILSARGEVRTFRFFPDRDQTPCIVTQGKVAAARTMPVADHISASVTIAAVKASADYFID
ncbi:MAG: hypothetical protein C0621_07445 [Desulfuromonas sp.]|nr:MAG: hypothetical protein C0621_07445 [Desulfuromonas sp.]